VGEDLLFAKIAGEERLNQSAQKVALSGILDGDNNTCEIAVCFTRFARRNAHLAEDFADDMTGQPVSHHSKAKVCQAQAVDRVTKLVVMKWVYHAEGTRPNT